MNIEDFMCEFIKDNEMVQVSGKELQDYIRELKIEIQSKDIALKQYKDGFEFYKNKCELRANMDIISVKPLRKVTFDVKA